MEQEAPNNRFKTERFIEIVTDASVQHLESEIKSLSEKRKLTIWIAGLATALEVYILNRFSSVSIEGFNSFLYYTAGVTFLHNAFTALTTYRMTTDLVHLHLKQQDRYRYQRILILAALDRNNEFSQTIIQDTESAVFVLKLQELNYFNGKKAIDSPYVKLGKRLVHYSDKSASWILLIQLFASVILLLSR